MERHLWCADHVPWVTLQRQCEVLTERNHQAQQDLCNYQCAAGCVRGPHTDANVKFVVAAANAPTRNPPFGACELDTQFTILRAR
eukprot:gene11099-biopygen3548